MSLLGIIETLRRNLKAVAVASCVVLALLVAADVVRLMTASGEHEAAPTKEGAAEHSAHPGAQAVPDVAVAAFGEHATEEAGFHEEAPAHGFRPDTGRITAYRSGHRLNAELVRELLRQDQLIRRRCQVA